MVLRSLSILSSDMLKALLQCSSFQDLWARPGRAAAASVSDSHRSRCDPCIRAEGSVRGCSQVVSEYLSSWGEVLAAAEETACVLGKKAVNENRLGEEDGRSHERPAPVKQLRRAGLAELSLYKRAHFRASDFPSCISFTQLVVGPDRNHYFEKSRLDQHFGRRNEFRES